MILPVLVVVAALADGSLPDAQQLIDRAMGVRKAQEAKGWKYTYREDEEWRDATGNPMTPFLRTYDVIMLEGDNYRKLILFDGKPIDAKTAKKVEAELAKTREERKKRKAFHTVVHLGDLDTLNRLFDSKVTGEETIGGRKAWRVESDPKPGVKATTIADEELLATHRTTWFDEEEGIDLQRHTTYLRGVRNIRPGSEGEVEFGRIGEAWLPVRMVFRGEAKFYGVVSAFADRKTRYYDYKRFSVETTFTPN
jgi:hypothetical protein